jgi:hypothetical protein
MAPASISDALNETRDALQRTTPPDPRHRLRRGAARAQWSDRQTALPDRATCARGRYLKRVHTSRTNSALIDYAQ